MLEVINSGGFSSVQDLGRYGHERYGVPLAGAMDQISFGQANKLLKNEPNHPCIEMTLNGGEFLFHENTYIAISGSEMNCQLNFVHSLPLNQPHAIKKGDIISFRKSVNGVYSYLAIKNGFQTERVMGSRSQYQGITRQNRLHQGDQINYESVNKSLVLNSLPACNLSGKISAYPGPEFHLLTKNQRLGIQFGEFHVNPSSNRMAYQFMERIEGHNVHILTNPVQPGTVQLTPSGHLIVLMRDAQTTGGYPRVLQLTEESISILSQRAPKSTVQWILKPSLLTT